MSHAWLKDVLVDMRNYTELNDLDLLAKALDDALDAYHQEAVMGPGFTDPSGKLVKFRRHRSQ